MKWVQNRPFDILGPRIDITFYGESHGSNPKIYGYRKTIKNNENHLQSDLSSALKNALIVASLHPKVELAWPNQNSRLSSSCSLPP